MASTRGGGVVCARKLDTFRSIAFTNIVPVIFIFVLAEVIIVALKLSTVCKGISAEEEAVRCVIGVDLIPYSALIQMLHGKAILKACGVICVDSSIFMIVGPFFGVLFCVVLFQQPPSN
jgi:hypothetical protein